MSHQPVIDGLDFARTGAKLQGALPVADFPRLRDALRTDEGTLHYELRGVPQEQGHPAISLKVDGALQFSCQRCLGALEYPMHIEVLLQLAATQAEAEAEPLQAEGPELVVAGRQMPVRDLVEDELLLAIPLAPRHERCAGREPQAARDAQSPFAGLRGLFDGTRH